MTTTITSTDTAFDQAIHAAIREAAQIRNFGIVYAASRRGFQAATAVLAEVFKLAAKQNDTGLLKALHVAHYSGAQVALNHAERIQGLSQTPAPGTHINDHMARTGDLQEADKQFEAMARKHFIGEAFGLERVAAAREFDTGLAARDRRRAESATPNVAASWPI